MDGVSTDTWREVSRIVRGLITKGATQIPHGEPGIVIVQPTFHAPLDALVAEVQRWMSAGGEGADYPNLVGVLALVETWTEPRPGIIGTVDRLVPVWRQGAPSWIVDGPWEQLDLALALPDLDALAKRCSDAGVPLAV